MEPFHESWHNRATDGGATDFLGKGNRSTNNQKHLQVSASSVIISKPMEQKQLLIK